MSLAKTLLKSYSFLICQYPIVIGNMDNKKLHTLNANAELRDLLS